MFEEALITNIMSVSAALLIIIISSMLLRKARFPYTIGLVLAGMGAAWIGFWVSPEQIQAFQHLYFQPAVVIYVLLPTLLFEAALTIDSRLLIKSIFPVVVLAIPGVVLSALIIGFGLHTLVGLNLVPALIFGSLISATDPVAVVHVFKEVGVPKKLAVLVDGESLFNDAAAIVLFDLVVSLFLHQSVEEPSALTLLKGIWDFHYVFLGGVVVGYVIAYGVTKFMTLAKEDPLVQITAMTLVAYVAFIVANYYLQVSGVMATLTAGIVVNWYGAITLPVAVRSYIKQFWSYAAFIANSIIFLLLGITSLEMGLFQQYSPHLLLIIACALLLVVLSRGMVVYVMLPMVSRLFRKTIVRRDYLHIVFWGGLRGALPLALALSLDPHHFHRPLVITLALSTVLFTLFLQGTTLTSLMHWLKMDLKTPVEELNEVETRLAMRKQGLSQLKAMEKMRCFDDEVIEHTKEEITREIDQLSTLLTPHRKESDLDAEHRNKLLWDHAMMAERKIYEELFERGLIPYAVMRELDLNIALTKDRIKHGEYPELFVFHIPLETRFKGWLGSKLIRFTRGRLSSKLVQQAYITKYELSLALAIASQEVDPVVRELGHLYGLDQPLVDECLRFYAKRRELALNYLQDIAEEDVPASFRAEKVRMGMLRAEQDRLQTLNAANTVSEKVLSELNEEMVEDFAAIQRRIAKTPVTQLL